MCRLQWQVIAGPERRLKQLIYASTAIGDPASTAVAVLEKAAVFNVSRRITGLMLVGTGSFAQLLEGGEAEVNDLYARISRDSRHHQIRLVSEHTVSQRLWPAWAMHVVAQTPDNVRILESHGASFGDHFAAMPVSRLRGLLYAFSETALAARVQEPRVPSVPGDRQFLANP